MSMRNLYCLSFISISLLACLLGVGKVSMLTHTYQHKPLRENKATTCHHQADNPLYVWPDVWSGDRKFRKKYGHTWHWMSLLRPGVTNNTNQTKPFGLIPLSCYACLSILNAAVCNITYDILITSICQLFWPPYTGTLEAGEAIKTRCYCCRSIHYLRIHKVIIKLCRCRGSWCARPSPGAIGVCDTKYSVSLFSSNNLGGDTWLILQ